MITVFWFFILFVSLTVLIKASDYFLESAEQIGIHIKIPKFVIGATIIAFGTSLPELLSSIVAVYQNSSEIVIGNVVGSNITNIFLILGVTGILFKDFTIKHKSLLLDLAILLFSALLLGIAIWDNMFTAYEAIIFLLLLIGYLLYVFNIKETKEEGDIPGLEFTQIDPDERKMTWVTPLILVISGLFIYLGANYTVEAVIKLSVLLKIGKEVIAISAVALGTSLPELIVCLAAVKKGKVEMVLGNIIGSNIFNTLVIMGVPALFHTLLIPENVVIFAYPVMSIATMLLLLVIIDRKLSRFDGIFLTVFYLIFIVVLFLKPQ
jgi:cation:H+ antiporter